MAKICIWMSSQLIVQHSYIIYFDIWGSFLATFCTSYWKKVHISNEIINLQGVCVLTVGYVDIKTYLLTKYYYIIERVYFICNLFIFISTFSFLLFLCTVSWRYKRGCAHASIDILFKLCSILSTWWKNIRLFYTAFLHAIQKRSWFEPAPQSTICI